MQRAVGTPAFPPACLLMLTWEATWFYREAHVTHHRVFLAVELKSLPEKGQASSDVSGWWRTPLPRLHTSLDVPQMRHSSPMCLGVAAGPDPASFFLFGLRCGEAGDGEANRSGGCPCIPHPSGLLVDPLSGLLYFFFSSSFQNSPILMSSSHTWTPPTYRAIVMMTSCLSLRTTEGHPPSGPSLPSLPLTLSVPHTLSAGSPCPQTVPHLEPQLRAGSPPLPQPSQNGGRRGALRRLCGPRACTCMP